MPGQDRRPVYKFGAWEIDLARREMRLAIMVKGVMQPWYFIG
jgi:hypothetical protein